MTAYYIKFTNKNGETVGSKLTHSYVAFRNFFRRTKCQHGHILIRFTYGMENDANGKMVKFSNEGEYKTKKQAEIAIKAFQEVA